MDRLPRDRVAAVYGAPSRAARCGSSDVWIYDEPGHLFAALRAASPFLDDRPAATR